MPLGMPSRSRCCKCRSSPAPTCPLPPHGVFDLPFMSASSRSLIDSNLAAIASLLARSPAQHLPTLLQGNAGIALFHAYLYLYQQDESLLEPFIQHLEAAVEATNSTDQTCFLGTGFTGLSWVIAHLVNLGVLDEDAAAIVEDVRPMVIASLSSFYLDRDYDLFYGFIGTSLFLTEDAGQDHRALQETLLLRLEDLALPMPVGVAWNATINSPEERAERSAEVVNINLGLAHGSPGIIMFLLGLHQQGVAPEKCRALLEQALAFLLAQELTDGPSLFPSTVAADTQQGLGPSQLAWCYGDLGIAYVLLRAGGYFRNDAWYRKGLQVALHAAGRDVGSDQRMNTGFCHGTAGIAFLFQRLFELTGDAALGQRAQEWLAITLEHLPAQLQALQADFSIRPFDPGSPTDMEQRYGLLEGLAGTGLVLTAFASPAQTGWSKLFLLHP
jgi:lantibiotic biosynthesis protein